jgi:hypothetical protein
MIWRSHSGGYEQFCLLGYNAVSPLKVNRRFEGTYRLHHQGRRICRARNQSERWQAEVVSCLAYSSTLKTEAICSSETSVDFQRTTRRYISEDKTPHEWNFFFVGMWDLHCCTCSNECNSKPSRTTNWIEKMQLNLNLFSDLNILMLSNACDAADTASIKSTSTAIWM